MAEGFRIDISGIILTEQEGTAKLGETEYTLLPDGSARKVDRYISMNGDAEIRYTRISYPDFPIIMTCVDIANVSAEERAFTIERVDTVNGCLPSGNYTLDYYESGHGTEFSPVKTELSGTRILQSVSGRSSKGMVPWFSLSGGDGSLMTGSVAWSGNWIIRFEPEQGDRYRISGGLHDWKFAKTLLPGEKMEGIPFISAAWAQGGQQEARNAFGRWGRKYWYAQNDFSRSMPTEWNHWWPYEDSMINEAVFRANVDECASLGIEVCTLDAGWFGEPDEDCNKQVGWSNDVDWWLKRGDWHKVNTRRFPSGIQSLGEYIHAKGMKFGLWCEIEALGRKADIGSMKPDLAAMRDGEHLGYACMGNPNTVSWAFGVLEKLILEYGADWLKLDCNIDPGAGCNRTDHGHGPVDGLYEHVQGYYRLLTMVREKYPEVILENCSSGGLRIDLGLMRHTHLAFLSDPDYTPHHLQTVWGATSMLHPSVCLHFTWSQNLVFYDNFIDKDPIKPDMPAHVLDYMLRANMLNVFGISYRLPELPDWCKERLKVHISLYKEQVRPLIIESDMVVLTGQTLRSGGGDRWNGFQFVSENEDSPSLAMIFRLTGSDKSRHTKLQRLKPDKLYRLRYEDSGAVVDANGASLMEEGILMEGLEEQASELIWIEEVKQHG